MEFQVTLRKIARSDTKVFAHSKLFATDKRAAAAANSDLYYDNTIAKNKQGGQIVFPAFIIV